MGQNNDFLQTFAFRTGFLHHNQLISEHAGTQNFKSVARIDVFPETYLSELSKLGMGKPAGIFQTVFFQTAFSKHCKFMSFDKIVHKYVRNMSKFTLKCWPFYSGFVTILTSKGIFMSIYVAKRPPELYKICNQVWPGGGERGQNCLNFVRGTLWGAAVRKTCWPK